MTTREKWIEYLHRITMPVFDALEKAELKEKMPCRFYGKSDRSAFAELEAFGRSMAGIGPFLGDFLRSEEEEELARGDRAKIAHCLDLATNPDSPAYMNFTGERGAQPLVDAAFLAHGLVRAKSFTKSLPWPLRMQIANALAQTRSINPHSCNWVLFSAMVEVGIKLLGGKYDMMRILYPLRQFMDWYKGDGIYGDGAPLHADYYNSFVIMPMLTDIVLEMQWDSKEIANMKETVLTRGSRYADILEHMIGSDGTYPYVGRSIVYRMGAFQWLAQAMTEELCDLSPAAVRCALDAVIDRFMHAPIFDEQGWLVHGLYGEQPSLAENYINTGSLYLCSTAFLPLGLPESHPFWSDPDAPWTAKRILAGENVPADHSIS